MRHRIKEYKIYDGLARYFGLMFKDKDQRYHVFNVRDFDKRIEGAFLKENLYCTFLNKDYRVINILYLEIDRTIPIPPQSTLMIETFFKPKWDIGHKILLKGVRQWRN
jgi:hypothetical protein